MELAAGGHKKEAAVQPAAGRRTPDAGARVSSSLQTKSSMQRAAMARCGRCQCECAAGTTTTHADVVRNRNDGPDAVLEGLAMAGLVAILRQLGDLAELAAEVFDDMQGQVMAASARGRRLAVRAKRLLEADLDLPPPTSTNNSVAAAAALTITASSSSSRLGCREHPRGGVVAGGTPPIRRVVVQRIRRCRGPPRLSLLDKFDAAGEGACLKRYTDPSFFRAHSSAKLEQGRVRAHGNGPYMLKSMSMETSRPKFQTALSSELPESSVHAVTDCKSETETDASETPSPGFLNILRHLKQHRQAAAGAGSLFRMQQTAVDRLQSWPQLDTEKKLQGSSGTTGTGQPSPSPSPSELERTSSFEAWLPPDARRFTTTAAATHHHEHDGIVTQEPPHPHGASDTTTGCSGSVSHVVTTTSNADAALTLSSSTILKENKVKGGSNKSRSRYKAGSVEMIASRVSSLPRKLFMNIKHHNDCSRSDRATGTSSSLRISQATGIGECIPQVEAVPRATEAFLPVLLLSNPVYSSIHNSLLLLPENDEKCNSYLQHHESTSCNCNVVSVDAERHHQQECSNNSSTSETCGDQDPACASPADSKNLVLPGVLVLKRAGALAPENSSSQGTKVDTTPPLPPIPPMQWLSENVYTAGTRAASPKYRALWKKSLEADRADRDRSNDALHSVRTHVTETILARSQATSVSNENENANANASRSRDEARYSETEETSNHPQPFREDAMQASQGNVLKAGEFPVPAIVSEEDLRTQAQAHTCFQQDGRLQSSSGHSHHGSTEKRSQEGEASDSSSSSNLQQNESVFLSAIQELAKMSPPPSVPRPKYSMLPAGSHGRITLRNGPSLMHPSRNILDSRSVLIEQIKDNAMAGNPSFELKPVSEASSPVTGSPTNSKVTTILQRADDIRQAHANNNEESWSDESE